MPIELKKNLKNHNTLGFDINAEYFAEPSTCEEVIEIFKDDSLNHKPILVLGSGSNILFTEDFHGIVVSPSMKDISISDDSTDNVYLKVGAGVDWDFFVEYCCDRGWGGVENLSLIPGNVGASPVQNIGAYGSEAADSIHEVEYFDIDKKEFVVIKGSSCKFGYRESIFKRDLKGKAIITHVTFKLSKIPVLNTGYADVELAMKDVINPSISDVRRAIVNIRRNKLPDTKEIGNCGSFFKNPVVNMELAIRLKNEYPSLKVYPAGNNFAKLPAAWLIENCGFKGMREGNVGVHDKQALVLLAYKGATGNELLELAKKIRAAVFSKFEIDIEPEVNII